MIYKLKGILETISSNWVGIDCSGVCYRVLISQKTHEKLPPINQSIEMLIEPIYRQESQTLAGFLTDAEKTAFTLLMNVPGIGLSTTFNILSTLDPSVLYHVIQNKDKAVLTQIDGIGLKTAERMILELKNKVKHYESTHPAPPHDALEALVQLGFSKTESLKRIQKAQESHGHMLSTEELIYHVLKTIQ